MEANHRLAFDRLEGPAPARWKLIREHHAPKVISLFEQGHAVNSISKLTGLSRAMVNTCLTERGIELPSVSEGNRRSAAKMPADLRKQRAKAAHAAVRLIGRNALTQAEHARRKQSTLEYVGVGEREVIEKLTAKGIKCVPQFALEGYNIDIMAGPIAVEIHNLTTMPHAITQRLCRIVKLLRTGIEIVYLQTGPNWPEITDAAIDEIVAIHDAASRKPSAGGKYWVVRGDGQINTSAMRQFDEIADILMPHRGF
jgi:hypothetical protein